ncbi:hypothetical protein ACJJTC_000897 [Scirpophaga incertulas]
MELEKKNKERKILRTVFTKYVHEFETLTNDLEATGKYKIIEGYSVISNYRLLSLKNLTGISRIGCSSGVNFKRSDKFQYLIQFMTPDTEVKSFVDSFLPSGQCYAQCITELKSTFARDDLLIQMYVRELLGLILHKEKIGNKELTSSYDKLNAHLRCLEILGVTKDKNSAFLLPMVESALPLDILNTWERAKPLKIDDELSALLLFIKREVESEQRITMAKNSFGLKDIKSTSSYNLDNCGSREPTGGCLLTNIKDKSRCIYGVKKKHNSLACFKVQKMSIDERREHLKKQRACTISLKKGHHATSLQSICKVFGINNASVSAANSMRVFIVWSSRAPGPVSVWVVERPNPSSVGRLRLLSRWRVALWLWDGCQ